MPLLIALGGSVSGCARWNWRGPGYGEESTNSAAKLRPATGGDMAGLDSRAREIERNLGYR